MRRLSVAIASETHNIITYTPSPPVWRYLELGQELGSSQEKLVGRPTNWNILSISSLPFSFLQSCLPLPFSIYKDCGSAIGVLRLRVEETSSAHLTYHLERNRTDSHADWPVFGASQSQKQHQRSSLPIRLASSGVNQSDNISAPSSSSSFSTGYSTIRPSPQCLQHVPLYLILLAPPGTKPQPLLERSPSGVHSTTALPRLTNLLPHIQHSGVCHAVQLELHPVTLK